MRKLKVLDLCSGLNGWTRAFRERGHEVVALDVEPRFGAEITMDVRAFAQAPSAFLDTLVRPGWRPDVGLGSPPCEGMSVASIGKMWEQTPHGPQPKHDTARYGVSVLEGVLASFAELQPAYLWLENPRAMMRKLPQMAAFRRVEVSQCSYGNVSAKATDLWGRWPEAWVPRAFCAASPKFGVVAPSGERFTVAGDVLVGEHGERVAIPKDGRPVVDGEAVTMRVLRADGGPCHQWAPRGAKTGTQGVKGSAARAVIPYELSLEVCRACEEAFELIESKSEGGYTHARV